MGYRIHYYLRLVDSHQLKEKRSKFIIISGNHWITSSSIGLEIKVYDSKFSGSELSSSLTHQLAEVYKTLKTQEDDVTSLAVQIPPVQQQNGSNDCGLFAIAFALHAALGDNVEELEFDQSKMRDHIQKCFGKKYLDPFPTTSKKSKRSNHFPVREIELFCTCETSQT